MKKKSIFAVVISVVLCLCISVGAFAAVLYLNQASAGLFRATIEHPQNAVDEDQPMLYLKADGEDVGQTYYGAQKDVVLPILSDMEYNGITETWSSSDGRSPAMSDKIVLSAKNGDLDNVSYYIKVSGNSSVIPAIRFGIRTDYCYENGSKCSISSWNDFCQGEVGSAFAKTATASLGNGHLAEGEEVEVYLCAWVQQEDLQNLDCYDPDLPFTIEIVFVAE